MGIAYRIDTEIGITYAVYDGIIGEAEAIENEQRLIADPDWPPVRKLHLSDVTTMVPDPSLPQATMAQLEEMWREQAQKMDGFKIAVVATGTFDQAAQFRPAVSPYGTSLIVFNSLPRSEERRVGKECRARWSPCEVKKK